MEYKTSKRFFFSFELRTLCFINNNSSHLFSTLHRLTQSVMRIINIRYPWDYINRSKEENWHPTMQSMFGRKLSELKSFIHMLSHSIISCFSFVADHVSVSSVDFENVISLNWHWWICVRQAPCFYWAVSTYPRIEWWNNRWSLKKKQM